MTAQTVLITGTSTGIGKDAAIAAASAGWNVVATMRDLDRRSVLEDAATTAGVDLTILQLDVTDNDSTARAVDDTISHFGALDALVNNAGSAMVGTTELLSLDDFRSAMEVNFFGVVRMTQLALPHLRESRGRVLTVSSVGGIVGQPFNDAYCAAKFAIEGFLESLHPVAAAVGVGVSVIEPAAVASEFVVNAGIDRERDVAAAGVYSAPLRSYLERSAGSFAAAQPSVEVGELIARTLSVDPLPFRIQSSAGATAFVSGKLADLDGSVVTGMTAGWIA